MDDEPTDDDDETAQLEAERQAFKEKIRSVNFGRVK